MVEAAESEVQSPELMNWEWDQIGKKKGGTGVTAVACWDTHTLQLGLGQVRCERVTGLERAEAGWVAGWWQPLETGQTGLWVLRAKLWIQRNWGSPFLSSYISESDVLLGYHEMSTRDLQKEGVLAFNQLKHRTKGHSFCEKQFLCRASRVAGLMFQLILTLWRVRCPRWVWLSVWHIGSARWIFVVKCISGKCWNIWNSSCQENFKVFFCIKKQ